MPKIKGWRKVENSEIEIVWETPDAVFRVRMLKIGNTWTVKLFKKPIGKEKYALLKKIFAHVAKSKVFEKAIEWMKKNEGVMKRR